MGRPETEFLATDDDIAVLADLSVVWIDRVHDRKPPKAVVLDMDSSVSPTYGDQESTANNGHFGCTCYSRCSCSTTWAIRDGAVCVPATSTVPTGGGMS